MLHISDMKYKLIGIKLYFCSLQFTLIRTNAATICFKSNVFILKIKIWKKLRLQKKVLMY